MKKVTLDDVARLSGVSRAAASRALNDRPGVRDEVRERVVRMADHLGFRANRAARNLASGRSSIIGLVAPIGKMSLEPFSAAVLEATAAEAARRDLAVMVHLTAEEPGLTVSDFVRDGLLDGVLIGASAIGTWADELFDSSVPSVLIGTHPARADVASVDVENRYSAARMVTHLFDQGMRRVGCITGRRGMAAAEARLDGYRIAHDRAGRRVDDDLIVAGHFSRESGLEAAAVLLERGVDAIFASSDEMAVGAIWAAMQRGLTVPGDLLVGGFDGVVGRDFDGRTLTTIVQPFADIAQTSIDLLDRMIDGGAPERIVLSADFVLGTSTAVPAAVDRRATGSG